MGFLEKYKKKSSFQKFFRGIKNYSDKQIIGPSIDYVTGVPYINSLYTYTSSGMLSNQPEDYKRIMNSYIKKCPELLGIANAIATDIVSDGYKFIPVKKSGKKSNVEKAEEWTMKNFFKQEFKAGIFD